MGFWHRKVWPTIRDVETTENDFILKDPGPMLYDEYYPIPISAWEDMQQEDFWDIHVRKFGHGVLHYRNVNQGAKVTYSPPTNPSETRYKRSRATRVTGPFSLENQLFRRNLTSLELTLAMSTLR